MRAWSVSDRARLPHATAILALFGAAAGAGYAVSASTVKTEPLVWATLLLLVLIGLLIYASARGTFDLLSPPTVVLGLIAVQFPLQAFFTVLVDHYGSNLMPVEEWSHFLDIALASSVLASVAFLIGYLLPLAVKRSPEAGGMGASTWTGGRVGVVVCVLTAIGLLSYLRFMQDVGGVSFFVHNLQARVVLAQGRHDLLAGVAMIPLASVIWLAHLATRGERPPGRAIRWFVVHVALTSLVLFSLGGRSNLVEYWVTLVVVFHYGVRRLGIQFAAVFLAAAVVFLAVAGWYRASTAASSTAPVFSPGQVLSPHAVANEFFNYDISPLDVYVLALEKVPREIPYRMGRSVIDTVYQPIPRSVLPSKPPVLTAWYKLRLLDRTDPGGIRASALGEGYVNFGFVGVAVMLMAYGALARIFARSSARRDPFALVFYAIGVQYLIQLTIGAFDESTVNFAERALPLLLVARFLSSSGSRSAAPKAVRPSAVGSGKAYA